MIKIFFKNCISFSMPFFHCYQIGIFSMIFYLLHYLLACYTIGIFYLSITIGIKLAYLFQLGITCIFFFTLSISGIRSGAHILKGKNFSFQKEENWFSFALLYLFFNVHKIFNELNARYGKCTRFRFGLCYNHCVSFWLIFCLFLVHHIYLWYIFCLSLIYDSHIEGEFKNPYVWLRGSISHTCIS